MQLGDFKGCESALFGTRLNVARRARSRRSTFEVAVLSVDVHRIIRIRGGRRGVQFQWGSFNMYTVSRTALRAHRGRLVEYITSYTTSLTPACAHFATENQRSITAAAAAASVRRPFRLRRLHTAVRPCSVLSRGHTLASRLLVLKSPMQRSSIKCPPSVRLSVRPSRPLGTSL